MRYRQFEETLQSLEILNSRILPLWFFPRNAPLKEITRAEEEIANQLPPKRSKQFKHARGYTRFALSQVLNIDPIEIPMTAEPGKAPQLAKGLGHISFSHCSDALLIGWCPDQVGVDLERSDRDFSAKNIVNRYFNKQNQPIINDLDKEITRLKVLQHWVVKEASIKWQRGKLIEGLMGWNWEEESGFAINEKLNYKLKVHLINFKCWHIAIAYKQSSSTYKPMICVN